MGNQLGKISGIQQGDTVVPFVHKYLDDEYGITDSCFFAGKRATVVSVVNLHQSKGDMKSIEVAKVQFEDGETEVYPTFSLKKA